MWSSLVYRVLLLGSLLFAASASLEAAAEDYPFITVASTTSTEQSGLLGYFIPAFRQTSGIDIYVVAVGTGEALEIGERGECDVVLVHDKARELQFMRDGFGSVRREVMYNDFVVVGPRNDPAKISRPWYCCHRTRRRAMSARSCSLAYRTRGSTRRDTSHRD